MTKFAYVLETEEEEVIGWSEDREFRHLPNFSYFLETDEEEERGRSDVRYSNNCPSSLTS